MRWTRTAPVNVTVPRVVGKTVDQAGEILEARGLRLAVVDQVYDPEIPEGQIVWAQPAPGRIVREGRQIRVRVSRGARAIATPDITRLNIETATKRLAEVGLKAEVKWRSHSEAVAEDAVISQSPSGGRRVREGDTVALLLSDGPPEDATEPSPVVDTEAFPKRSATVEFDVPSGDQCQRVRIRVIDELGERTVYDGLHEPGDHIEQTVSGSGETRVLVLLDEQMIEDRELRGQ